MEDSIKKLIISCLTEKEQRNKDHVYELASKRLQTKDAFWDELVTRSLISLNSLLNVYDKLDITSKYMLVE